MGNGTYPLDQQHADEVGLLTRLVNRDTRKPAQKDLVDSLVVEDLVDRERQAVGDRGHDLLGMLVV